VPNVKAITRQIYTQCVNFKAYSYSSILSKNKNLNISSHLKGYQINSRIDLTAITLHKASLSSKVLSAVIMFKTLSGCGSVLVSALGFRSDGRWLEAYPYRQETPFHILSPPRYMIGTGDFGAASYIQGGLTSFVLQNHVWTTWSSCAT